MNRIEFVLVLLFTFFVIVVWVTSDVILVKPNTPDDPKIQTMIEPLTPTFDQETLNKISSRTLSTPIKATPRPVAQPVVPPPTDNTQPTATTQPSSTPTPAIESSTEIPATEIELPAPPVTPEPIIEEITTP